MPGSHEYADDPRNASVLIHVNGELLPRPDAKVSVLDAGFLLGDGVWESFRLHRGTFAFLELHLARLFEGAAALALDIGKSKEELEQLCRETVDANHMHTDVHVRLIVSRGLKATPYQDPRVTVTPPTIVIIPEYKVATDNPGMRIVTVDVRRGTNDSQDPRINSLSKHNCIQACIAATSAGADEGLMLDPDGFVATCNSTNFFMVQGGEVWTSSGRYCLPGITRGNLIRLCRENDIPVFEKQFTVDDVHGADEAFVTGTFAGVVPVVDVDGHAKPAGPVTRRLRELYRGLVERECE